MREVTSKHKGVQPEDSIVSFMFLCSDVVSHQITMEVHVDEINTNNLCIFVLYRQRGTESAKVEVGIY